MKEVIKTISLLIAFIVMLVCVYLETDIKTLVSRTLLTLVATFFLGHTAYGLSSVMVSNHKITENNSKSRTQSRIKAKA